MSKPIDFQFYSDAFVAGKLTLDDVKAVIMEEAKGGEKSKELNRLRIKATEPVSPSLTKAVIMGEYSRARRLLKKARVWSCYSTYIMTTAATMEKVRREANDVYKAIMHGTEMAEASLRCTDETLMVETQLRGWVCIKTDLS